MRRIVVCLLIALASAGAAARESKLSDADGGSCPSSHSARPTTSRAVDRSVVTTPAPAKAKRSSQGASDDVGGRLQSPRWHRFLPGMFR